MINLLESNLDWCHWKRIIYYYFARLLVHIDCLIEYGNNYVTNVEKEQEIMALRKKLLEKEVLDSEEVKKIVFQEQPINNTELPSKAWKI